jgi:flavin-binding protein dodecin
MAVERVSRIVATSPKSFEDAIHEGLKRANKTLRNLRRMDVVSHAVRLNQGRIQEYEVTLDITFVLE